MSARSKRSGMVSQGGVMIPQTEAPVLKLDDSSLEAALALIPDTVNFLRCGCPGVQWLVTIRDFQNSPGSRQIEAMDGVHDALSTMQERGENFKMELPARLVLGSIITITCTVGPKTKETTFIETTFDKLKVGEEFTFPGGDDDDPTRHMKIERTKEGLDVVILGKKKDRGAITSRGELSKFERTYGPVLKVID